MLNAYVNMKYPCLSQGTVAELYRVQEYPASGSCRTLSLDKSEFANWLTEEQGTYCPSVDHTSESVWYLIVLWIFPWEARAGQAGAIASGVILKKKIISIACLWIKGMPLCPGATLNNHIHNHIFGFNIL